MPRRLETLKEFGLSDYASRAYLALLDLGDGDARAVANASRVPVAKVHATLRQLEEKGLVDVLPGTPKRYHPRPFSEFLRRAAKEHAERAEALHAESERADSIFRIARAIAPDDRTRVKLVRGRRNGLDKWRELVEAAERDVLIVGADQMGSRADRLVAVLRAASERGVRVRVLARPTPELHQALAALRSVAEVRDKSGLPTQSADVTLTLVDEHIAFLSHAMPDDASRGRGQDIALCMEVSGWARFLRDLVEHHWAGAGQLR